MRRSQLYTIFFVVFIVMLGFGLLMPLLPYYVTEYGGNALLLGLLMSSYAAAQFVGAPLLGRLSDRMGRRPILIASLSGTTIGFVLLGLAAPIGRGLASLLVSDPTATHQNAAILGVMFFARILSGASGGMLTAAQAYIADVTDVDHRTQALAYTGAAFGLGFILGPVIGGVLSTWGLAVPAFVAAGLAMLNLFTVIVVLPESLTAARMADLANQPGKALISLTTIVRRMTTPGIGPLLTIRLFASVAGSLFFSLFTMWSKERLGLDAQTVSYVLAYQGTLSIIVQVALIGPLTRRFSEARLITAAVGVLAVALLAWALTPSVAILLLVLIPQVLSSGTLNTVINSAITWLVTPEEMGDALGTAAALDCLARMVAPSLGGWMLGGLGTWAPGVLGAAILSGLTVFAWRRLIVAPIVPQAAQPVVA
ncbi:MAG: MFS transporter [Anaerolineae bacterium]|nr:MFS transporter [Anaerolineae bacterium]